MSSLQQSGGSRLERGDGQISDAGKVRELQREFVHPMPPEILDILQAKTRVQHLQVLRVQKLQRV